MVLGVATVLGVIGPLAAFGLLYLGERVYHLDRAHIQTMMYLMLSVAGHLTIFPDTYTRAVLVHTSLANFMDSRARHTSSGYIDRCVWIIYDANRLGLVAVCLGVCNGVVPC